MLKNIDPILTPDALYALSCMGHGDEVVVCDAHFPADSVARTTTHGRVIRMDGADTREALRGILSVLELDTQFVDHPAERLMIDGHPDNIPHVQQEASTELRKALGKEAAFRGTRRAEFVIRARAAYAVIQTGETRAYGCFIFRKGLIATPDAPASAGQSHLNQYAAY